MLGQFEDADKADDAEEGEGCARLGAGAAHSRQNVEQRHVVRNNRHNVHHVLEILPEPQLSRARHEPHRDLDGKPGCAGGLDDEERIEKVRGFILDAVSRGKRRQSFKTKEDDGDEGDGDRQQSHDEAGPRGLRVLEQLPESAKCRVGWQTNLVSRVTF